MKTYTGISQEIRPLAQDVLALAPFTQIEQKMSRACFFWSVISSLLSANTAHSQHIQTDTFSLRTAWDTPKVSFNPGIPPLYTLHETTCASACASHPRCQTFRHEPLVGMCLFAQGRLTNNEAGEGNHVFVPESNSMTGKEQTPTSPEIHYS